MLQLRCMNCLWTGRLHLVTRIGSYDSLGFEEVVHAQCKLTQYPALKVTPKIEANVVSRVDAGLLSVWLKHLQVKRVKVLQMRDASHKATSSSAVC